MIDANDSGALHDAVRILRTPATVRERCAAIAAAVGAGRSPHFEIDRGRLNAVAQRVAKLTRDRYPTLDIPYHSRWRHFEAGRVDRKSDLDARLLDRSTTSAARARIDLTLISVLLDAGAGPQWKYLEAAPSPQPSPKGRGSEGAFSSFPPGEGSADSLPPGEGSAGSLSHWERVGVRASAASNTYTRSEGLAVATFRAFMAGRFSSDPGDPVRVDAAALLRMNAETLADIFQVRADNPLVGLDGRAALLRRLGEALRSQPALFTTIGQPGHLFDALTHHSHAPKLNHHRPAVAAQVPRQHHLKASRILGALLDAFSEIWPSGQSLGDLPMGDVWRHPHAGGQGSSAGIVPFHKLSQWLTYSLLEPFEWAGVTVTDLDELTALPEYRNGGLLIDAGVIVPRDKVFASQARAPADEWVVEWRALTVALIDELAPLVRGELGLSASQLPLARILEGGTWAAGRQIAKELRDDGSPPVTIQSDGTVF